MLETNPLPRFGYDECCSFIR